MGVRLGITNPGLVRATSGLTATVSGTAIATTTITKAKLERSDGWASLADKKAALFVPFGTHASAPENKIGNWQLQIAVPVSVANGYDADADDGSTVSKFIISLACGTFTLGTLTGAAAGDTPSNSEYLADTIAVAVNAAAKTAIETLQGVSLAVCSPADNGVAFIGMADFGPARWGRLLVGLGGSATATTVGSLRMVTT